MSTDRPELDPGPELAPPFYVGRANDADNRAADAVAEWSRTIHGSTGDRAEWGHRAAEAIRAGRPFTEHYPRGRGSTPADRLATVARIADRARNEGDR